MTGTLALLFSGGSMGVSVWPVVTFGWEPLWAYRRVVVDLSASVTDLNFTSIAIIDLASSKMLH
jgi:hypothetical protein